MPPLHFVNLPLLLFVAAAATQSAAGLKYLSFCKAHLLLFLRRQLISAAAAAARLPRLPRLRRSAAREEGDEELLASHPFSRNKLAIASHAAS